MDSISRQCPVCQSSVWFTAAEADNREPKICTYCNTPLLLDTVRMGETPDVVTQYSIVLNMRARKVLTAFFGLDRLATYGREDTDDMKDTVGQMESTLADVSIEVNSDNPDWTDIARDCRALMSDADGLADAADTASNDTDHHDEWRKLLTDMVEESEEN